MSASFGGLALAQNGPENARYIVTVDAASDPAQVAATHGLAARQVFTTVLNGFAADVPAGRMAALARDARVKVIAVDHPVFAFAGKPTKPPPTTVQVLPAGVTRIGADQVWSPATGAGMGAGIGVAILDTGLDFNHPDLKDNISTAWFVSPGFTYTTSAQDDAGHGTHVGGIVAAVDNSIDVVGVAPKATLFAVKVLNNQGSGYDSDIIGGLNWVAANGNSQSPPIKVVNMSLGRGASKDDSLMHTAIKNVVNANITVVVSAGNDSSKDVSQMVPAGFPEVIAVASTTAKDGTSNVSTKVLKDTASYFTTDGAGVTISAPGEEAENIKYPRLSSVGILSLALGGGTTRMSGTSMSAPHVTGVVALLLEKAKKANVTLNQDQMRARISAGDRVEVAPLDSPANGYTYDGFAEGILYAPNVISGL